MKKIVFEEKDKNHADLIIKLRTLGIPQRVFFQNIVRAFIDDNPHLDSFFQRLIIEESKLGRTPRQKVLKSKAKGNHTYAAFGFSEEERSNIFDILESEGEQDE